MRKSGKGFHHDVLCRRHGQFMLFVQALVSAWALSMSDLSVPDVEWVGIHDAVLWALYSLMVQLQEAFEDQVFILSVLTFGLFLLYRRVWHEKGAAPVRYSRLLSAVLAVLYTGGLAFYCEDTLSILWRYKLNWIRTIVLLCGTYWFYLTCIRLLYDLLHRAGDMKRPAWKILRVYRAHPWLSVWVVLMIAWLPHLILRYPGAMSYDNYNELMYYYGEKVWSGTQPIFHTWLFGSIVNLGYRIGHPNLGLFAFVLMQSLVMSAVLSASLYLMKRWGAPRWFRLLSLLLLGVGPFFAGNAAFPIKDYLYTAFLVALVLLIMAYMREPEWFCSGRKRILLPIAWMVSAALMMLCRNNGIYVYVVTVILMIPALIRGIRGGAAHEPEGICKKRPKDEDTVAKSAGADSGPADGDAQRTMSGALESRCVKSGPAEGAGKDAGRGTGRAAVRGLMAAMCLLVPVAAYKGTEQVITVVYDAEEGGAGEMYSLLFQQTARYVRDYGEEVTEEEAQAIAAVLDYDNLAELYQENISDPVKTTFHAGSTEEMLAYLKVWFQQFLKHPLCYLEATWNQNYSLFAPWKDNIVFNLNCNVGVDIWDSESSAFFHFTIPEWMNGFCYIATGLYALLSSLPVIGLFSNVAFYIILLFVLLIFYLGDGRLREAKGLIPLLLTFVFILLGPAVIPQPRYAFPIIYAMPAVIGFYMTGRKENPDGCPGRAREGGPGSSPGQQAE